jgi:hypothetical protein
MDLINQSQFLTKDSDTKQTSIEVQMAKHTLTVSLNPNNLIQVTINPK